MARPQLLLPSSLGIEPPKLRRLALGVLSGLSAVFRVLQFVLVLGLLEVVREEQAVSYLRFQQVLGLSGLDVFHSGRVRCNLDLAMIILLWIELRLLVPEVALGCRSVLLLHELGAL